MKTNLIRQLAIVILLTLSSPVISASVSIEKEFFVIDPGHIFLNQHPELAFAVIDHVSSQGFEIYGPESLRNKLADTGAIFYEVQKQKNLGNDYPTHAQVEKRMTALAKKFPQTSQLISLGKSVQGRNLLAIKISADAASDKILPEFKYIANMHGDEITGREVMLLLAEDLLIQYERKDTETVALLQNSEIFILPSLNPDGAELRQRANAQAIDLNRSFPDFASDDHENQPRGRSPEVQAIMKWQKERNFSLSANFHGGSEVVNYPWDTQPNPHPETELFSSLSLSYADKVSYLRSSSEFSRGITNGYAWYEVKGGMQDWSNYWYNDMQVTIEISSPKWPSFSKIPYYYSENKTALLAYLKKINQGAGFYFYNNHTVTGTVEIADLKSHARVGSFGFDHGEFYKVLLPGEYEFRVKASGKTFPSFSVKVSDSDRLHTPVYQLLSL